MNMNDLNKNLLKEIKLKAVQYGSFKLASGGVSNYFLDMKRVTMNSKGSLLVGNTIAREMICSKTISIGGGDGNWSHTYCFKCY